MVSIAERTSDKCVSNTSFPIFRVSRMEEEVHHCEKRIELIAWCHGQSFLRQNFFLKKKLFKILQNISEREVGCSFNIKYALHIKRISVQYRIYQNKYELKHVGNRINYPLKIG